MGAAIEPAGEAACEKPTPPRHAYASAADATRVMLAQRGDLSLKAAPAIEFIFTQSNRKSMTGTNTLPLTGVTETVPDAALLPMAFVA